MGRHTKWLKQAQFKNWTGKKAIQQQNKLRKKRHNYRHPFCGRCSLCWHIAGPEFTRRE